MEDDKKVLDEKVLELSDWLNGKPAGKLQKLLEKLGRIAESAHTYNKSLYPNLNKGE